MAEQLKKTKVKCVLCSSRNAEYLGHLANTIKNLSGPSGYDLLECAQCGTAFIDPVPEEETLIALYASSRHEGDAYIGDKVWDLRRFYLRRLISLKAKMGFDVLDPIKILEVGAGKAWMCGATDQLNHNSLTVAQDITAEVPPETYGVKNYICGSIYDNEKEVSQLGPFNLISLTHVLEHVKRLLKIIQFCAKYIMPGGIIFISKPHRPMNWSTNKNIENWRNWSLNHVPAHLQYFSKKSVDFITGNTGLKTLFFDNTLNNGIGLEIWLTK